MSEFLNEVKQRLKDSGDEPKKIVKKKKRKKAKKTTSNTSIIFDDSTDLMTVSNCTISNSTIPSGTLLITGTGVGTGSTDITLTDFQVYDPAQERQDELLKRMDLIEEKLLILQNNIEKHEKYPALKDLYDQYKMIEAIIGDDIKKEENED